MSQTFSKKKLQVANSTLVNFFEMKKISFQKKIQVWDLIGGLIPHLYFLFEIENFSFSKKITSVGLSGFQKKLQVLN